jgi:branched-chain amino acid transport system ATP-binding protein
MSLLSLEGLVVRYGEIEALHGVSLAVEPGEVVTLLGSNGAGKSTTLRTISGLLKPVAGQVSFDGKPITGLRPEVIVKLGIAHVPEGRRLFPGLTSRENMMLGAANRGRIAKAQLLRETDEMFDLFPDIRPFADALGWTLSGGQQQMVAVARGLMAKPRLLLLDEPSLGLAPSIVGEMFRAIELIQSEGVAILLVEQNVAQAMAIADRAYVLEEGRIVAAGLPAELLAQSRIKEAYLGL